MGQSKHVLLVGNGAKCDYLQILESAGYSVDTAGEEEAEERLESGDYDLVVKASEDAQCVQLRGLVQNRVDWLSEGRRFLGLILNSTPEAISYINDTLTYEQCNTAAAEQLGRTVDEVIGHSVDELVGRDSPVYEAIVGVLRSGKPHASELKVALPHKRELGELDYLVYYTPDLDASGKVKGVFASSRDVTERKRAEEALRDSDERNRALTEASSEAIYHMSPDWKEMWWLKGGGFIEDTDEPIRDWLQKYIHPDDQKQVLRTIKEAITAGRTFDLEHRVKRVDGTLGWTYSRAVPVRVAGGKIVEWFGAASDITERKTAEQALRKYQAFSENSRDIILFVRRDGQIIEANEAAVAAYGYSRDDLLKLSIFDLRAPETVPITEPQMTEADLKGILFETVHRRSDGSTFPVEVSSRGSDMDGQRVLLSVIRDITDRKRIEQQREELLEREKHIADTLQKSLVPATLYEPACCSAGVRYEAAFKEADVGGDFYDIFDMGDGRVGILIGDMAGKGLGAAIQASVVRHAVRSYAYISASPGKVMTLANEAFCKEGNGAVEFMTAFFAVIDTRAGLLSYANGGHESSLLMTAEGRIDELTIPGVALGVTGGFEYREGSRKLLLGDTLVMVTDGITEARPDVNDLFGLKGVKRVLVDARREAVRSADKLADSILEAAKVHAGGNLKDDAAVVVITWNADMAEGAS